MVLEPVSLWVYAPELYNQVICQIMVVCVHLSYQSVSTSIPSSSLALRQTQSAPSSVVGKQGLSRVSDGGTASDCIIACVRQVELD